MTSLTVQKIAKKRPADQLDTTRLHLLSQQIDTKLRNSPRRREACWQDEAAASDCTHICTVCSAYDLTLCAGRRENIGEANWLTDSPLFTPTVHTIPARRTICHPKEWSEFVTVICKGWAVSSITLADGRRQIMAFLLPGDIVSIVSLLEPMSGRTVEAITEVTYRRFKRSDLKAVMLKSPDLLDKISKAWIDERAQSDQLALDLGRRTADERIARLILSLAERLAKRSMRNGGTMEFPLRQRHIADATGLTPVHVSKVLSEFQRAGLVEIGGRTLTIINETDLRRAADWR